MAIGEETVSGTPWCPWCLKPIGGSRCPECHCSAVSEEEARLDGSERAGRMLNAPRYRVLGRLGQGAMGVVHRGYDRIRNRMVAIKFMTEGIGGAESSRTDLGQRVLEASALGRIRSPHVVEFLDFEISEDGIPCLVTALLRGEDLGRRLARFPGRRIPWREAVRIARETAEGLAAAHREGVLHGDLKPSNLFLEQGTTGPDEVRILDFGLATLCSGEGTVAFGQGAAIVGTFAYMAPELGYNQPLSERSDLYSLGILLYEMIVGRVPWSGPPMVILARKATEPLPPLPDDCTIPRLLARLIQDLLRTDSAGRPASAEEVAARLRSIEEGCDVLPEPETVREDPGPVPESQERKPAPRGRSSLRRFLLPAGLVAAAAIALGIWGVLSSTRETLAQVKASCAHNRPVRVRGTVRKAIRLPLGRFSLFQVADRSGSLWVFSMSGAPEEGVEVRLRGHSVPMDRQASLCEENGWVGEACASVLALVRMWTGPCLLVEDLREP